MRLRISILAGLIAFSTCAVGSVPAQTPKATGDKTAPFDSKAPAAETKIVAGIRKLGVLSPDAKLSVQLADKQAILTIYSGAYEKAAAALMKIDAVLLAKSVFDNNSDIVRAKIAFGSLRPGPQAGILHQVSISKGDIKAFASNQLTKTDLLASLEFVPLSQSNRDVNTAVLPAKTTAQSQDPLEFISAAGASGGRRVVYRNERTGLTLSYPPQWKLTEAPEKDTLFKIDSKGSAIGFGLDVSPGMSVKQAARLWENLVLSQLKDYKLVSSRRVRFGQNASLEGYSHVIQFSANGATIKQRWVFFGQTGCVYRAILSTTQDASKTDIADMYGILMSLTFTGGASAAQNPSQPATAIQPWTRLSLFQEEGMSLNYPDDWLVSQHPEPEVLVKFSGKTEDGEASLQVRKSLSDHSMSLEDVATQVETHYLKPLKNYRRFRQESVNLGGGAQGVRQEISFDLNGLPFRQINTYRREGNYLYTLSLTANNWKQADMLTLFNRCLGTWSIRE